MLKRVAAALLLTATFATAAHAEELTPGETWELYAVPAIEITADVEELASEVGLEPILLQGAVNTVKVSPRTYLQYEGRLEPPVSAAVAVPATAYGVWDRLAACEAGGNWHNASNPKYKGGIQADAAFWANYGGLAFAPRADLASREQQIVVAERGLKAQGWQAWPVCSRMLGLR
jgi:hypothetical protein